MFLGRAGVMALYAKRKSGNKDKNEQPKHQYLIEHQKQFQNKMNKWKKKGVLYYSSTPKGAWFLGLMFVMASIFLFYMLNSGILEPDHEIKQSIESQQQIKSKETLQEKDEQIKEPPPPSVSLNNEEKKPVTYWWRYLMTFMMGFVGVLFLITVDKESVEIQKNKKILVKHYTNPWLCCKRKTNVRNLELLADINIVKKGHETYSTSTIYYTVEFRYNEQNVSLHQLTSTTSPAKREEIIESNDLREIKKKYVEIMTFMSKEFDIGSIRVQDESTSTKKKNLPKKSTKINQDESQKLIQRKKYKEDDSSLYD